MLLAEGFELTGWVDIFEAGPVVSCTRDEIRTVKLSKRAKIDGMGELGDGAMNASVSNTKQEDFRACQTLITEDTFGGVRIPEDAARILELEIGDSIRYLKKEH